MLRIIIEGPVTLSCGPGRIVDDPCTEGEARRKAQAQAVTATQDALAAMIGGVMEGYLATRRVAERRKAQAAAGHMTATEACEAIRAGVEWEYDEECWCEQCGAERALRWADAKEEDALVERVARALHGEWQRSTSCSTAFEDMPHARQYVLHNEARAALATMREGE